jgi:hypothetical protein
LDEIPVNFSYQPNTRELKVRVSSMTVLLVLSPQSQVLTPRGPESWRNAGWQPLSAANVSIEQVEISSENRYATAHLNIRPTKAAIWHLDTRTPSLSMADTVACAGSLTQALLYQIDQVERNAVGNFWMRRAALAFDEPRPIPDGNADIFVHILRTTVLAHGARTWRTARVRVTGSFGLNIDADVAYELH